MSTVFLPEQYTHDSDRAALKALQAIPGFSALTKGFMNIWNERQQKILNMSSRIRLGERQMKKYYDMLPPICEKLNIPVPELYLEMNVVPNSYTSGDTNPYIVITSGMLKLLPEELVPTVLAHECGHIACRHVLFLTMGRMILQGAGTALTAAMKLGGLLTIPMQVAFYYWMRCSEFSADRAAVLCDGAPERMQEVCMRLAGWDREIDADVDMQAFLEQAADYRDLISESAWNKSLEFMILSRSSHPLTAVRAMECGEWARSDRFRDLLNGTPLIATDPQLPSRDAPVSLPAEPEPLRVPEDYRQIPSRPEDPEQSETYARVTTQSDCFIQVYPAAANDALPADGPEAYIRRLRRALSDDQGIVEVSGGTTANGNLYACSIVKRLRPREGTEYHLSVRLDRHGFCTAVEGYFSESSVPGFREAAVKGRLKRENNEDSLRNWTRDPYDPNLTSGALMNRSEAREYDTLFPFHALSEARRFADELIRIN